MSSRTLMVGLACLTCASLAQADIAPTVRMHMEHHGGRRAAGIVLTSIGGTLMGAGAFFAAEMVQAASVSGGEGGFAGLVGVLIGGCVAAAGLGMTIPGVVLIVTARSRPMVDEARWSAGPPMPSVHGAPLFVVRF